MLDPSKIQTASAAKSYIMLCGVVGSILLLPGLSSAQDVNRGHELAVRWCSGCHVADRSTTEARADGIPTFPAIASKPGISADQLRAAMNPTHGRMPDLALGKRDQDDLAAYILSLRRK